MYGREQTVKHTESRRGRAGRVGRVVQMAVALGLAVLFLLTGCSSIRPIAASKQDLRVVATCDGYDVCYDELRYITMAYRDEYRARYGERVFEDAGYVEKFRQDVEYALTANYAILSMCRELNLDLEDDAVTQAVQEKNEDAVDQLGGFRAYKDFLKQTYLTDHFLRFTLRTDQGETEIIHALMDVGVILKDEKDFIAYALDGNFCATYHVFIGNDEGDNIEENRANAALVRDKLLGGETIQKMMGSKYNEDTSLVSTPYYFTYGEYDEAYEQAAFGLEIGGISEVVETEDGFYVIVRQPLDEQYLVRNVTSLMQRYQYAEVERMLTDLRKDMTIEWNEYGASLDLLTME